MIKFLNKKIKKPQRVLIIGSSGIISENVQEYLQKNSINFKVIGSSEINLKKKNAHRSLNKKIKKNDVVIF